MARQLGFTSGSITFASEAGIVLHVRRATLNHNGAEVEISALADGQENQYLPGVTDATVNIEGFLDTTAAIAAPGAAAAVMTIQFSGAPTVQTRSFSGFWTQKQETLDRADANRITGTFRITGVVTRVP